MLGRMKKMTGCFPVFAVFIAGCAGVNIAPPPLHTSLLYIAPQGTDVEVRVKRLSVCDDREKLLVKTARPGSDNKPLSIIPEDLGSDKYGAFQGPYYPARLPAGEPIILLIDRIIDNGVVYNTCRSKVKMTPHINEIYVIAPSLYCQAYVDSFVRTDAAVQEGGDSPIDRVNTAGCN